nr:hypothetical protein [Tanacetum cinerariifolium]
QYTRRTRIAQSSVLPPIVDEPASPFGDDSQGEACPIDSGLEANQDKANISKTSTFPSDSTSRVTSLAIDEGSMQYKLTKFTDLVKLLEDRERGGIAQSGEDALIKGRSIDKGEKAAIDRNAASILTSGVSVSISPVTEVFIAEVLTGSGFIPTASPPIFGVPTGSGMVLTAKAQQTSPTTYSSPTLPPVTTANIPPVIPTAPLPTVVPTDTSQLRHYNQKARIAQSSALPPVADEPASPLRDVSQGEEAAERVSDDTEEMATVLTSMDAAIVLASGVAEVPTGSGSIPTAELPIERRIELISDLVRYQDNYAKAGWKAKHFKGMTLKEIKEKFDPGWKQIHDFIPIGSKEEAERFKRKGIRFEQESAKKLKTSEEVPEEVKSPDEVPKEKVKEMMQLVPIEEVYVKALQVKHPIIDWKLHTEGQRGYWKITRLRGSSASYQFFMDLLKHLDREDLNQLWALVKESLNIRPASIEWKLYDLCGVHHVTSKDKEIIMLIEKDYPLRKGLAIVMISYKLQVENYSQMANDLILKIYKIASSPRKEDD